MAELVDLPAGRQARWTHTPNLVKMYFVYAIKSLSSNYIYVGLTNDLERRFKEHQDGKGRATKPYRPFKLIYSEKVKTRIEARAREKFLKSGVGKEFLKNLSK